MSKKKKKLQFPKQLLVWDESGDNEYPNFCTIGIDDEEISEYDFDDGPVAVYQLVKVGKISVTKKVEVK